MPRHLTGALVGVGLLGAAGCTSGGSIAVSAEPFCSASVASFNNPDAGARGDFSPNVRFADLKLGPTSTGYGAAGGRSDEITIADGILHLARPNGAGSFSQRTAPTPGEGGYMVQLVTPGAWAQPTSLPAAASIDALGSMVSAAAMARGCSGPTKLAYRIAVHVVAAEWSLDTLPQRGDFTTADQDAIIVGLYATFDQARHSVTPGRNIHAHIVFPRLGIAGHLKSVQLAPGGNLMLQGG